MANNLNREVSRYSPFDDDTEEVCTILFSYVVSYPLQMVLPIVFDFIIILFF